MKTKHFPYNLLYTSILSGLLMSSTALANENISTDSNNNTPAPIIDKSTLESITVTARRKTESIVEIPMSISSISALEIEDRNYVDAKELYRTLAGAAMPRDQLILRGLSGGNDAQPNTTTTFVDDIPFEFTNLSDIERIEVLRGPQGTLYGSNAIGGTVRIITKKPVLDEFELFGSVQAGSEKNVDDLDSSYSLGVNIPLLADRLALRVSGNVTEDNLPYKNMKTNLQSDIKDSFIRSQLLWQVNPEFDITLGYSHVKKRSHGASQGDLSKPEYRNEYTLIDNADAPYGYDVEYYEIACPEGASRPECMGGSASIASSGTPSRYQLWEAIDPWLEEDTYLTTLNINHDNVLGLATLTYAGSYRKFDTKSLGNWSRLDGQDLFNTWLINDSDFDRQTHEIRFQNIDLNSPLTWTLGTYYNKKEEKNSDNNQSQFIEEGDITSTLAMNEWWGDDVSLYGQNTYGNPQKVYNYNLIKEYNREFSVFADIAYTFDLQEFGELELNAGVRHYDFKDSFHDSVSGVFISAADENDMWPEDVSKTSGEEDGERYKYSISWRPSDNFSVYGLYSEGYRPGGNNGPLNGSCVDDPNAGSYSPRYESDSIDNYELGIKGSSFENRFNFSLAAYHIDWTDIKTEIYMDSCGFAYLTNAGKAESDGFEFESSTLLTPDLTMTFNTSYTHSTIREDNEAINAEKGDDMTMVPDWNVYLALDQGFMFMNKQAYVRADYTYYGDYKSHFNTRKADEVSSYSYVNLSSRIELNESTKVGLYINNVFDDDSASYKRARSRNVDNSMLPLYVEYLPERNLTLRVDFAFY